MCLYFFSPNFAIYANFYEELNMHVFIFFSPNSAINIIRSSSFQAEPLQKMATNRIGAITLLLCGMSQYYISSN